MRHELTRQQFIDLLNKFKQDEALVSKLHVYVISGVLEIPEVDEGRWSSQYKKMHMLPKSWQTIHMLKFCGYGCSIELVKKIEKKDAISIVFLMVNQVSKSDLWLEVLKDQILHGDFWDERTAQLGNGWRWFLEGVDQETCEVDWKKVGIYRVVFNVACVASEIMHMFGDTFMIEPGTVVSHEYRS